MTAGLPGTGIGGLFYLVSALLMPVRELWLVVRTGGAHRPRPLAWRQAFMALAIVAVTWGTGEILMRTGSVERGMFATSLVPAAIAFSTLALILVFVEMLSAALRYVREQPATVQPLGPSGVPPGIGPSNDGASRD